MKKIILLFGLLLSMIVVNAQQDSLISDPENFPTKTGQVVNDVVTRVETAIYTLADNLKTPAEHVYKVLVKQERLEAIGWLICDVFLFIVVVILFLLSNFANNKDDDELSEVFGIGGIIILVIFLLISIFSFKCILTGFFNPEYGAIKEILNIL